MTPSRRSVILGPAVAVAALTLLAAGCGGGAKSPGVASVASSPTSGAATTSTTQSGSGLAPGGPGSVPNGAVFRVAMNVGNTADGAKFSACMRRHGVQNFPDPNSQGLIQFGSSDGIDPGSPTFQSAQTTCRKLLPNGGLPTPQQQAQRQQEALAFSKCMRAHGIKDFPDPSNGGVQLHGGPGSDLNPGSPQFQAAQKACQGFLPFKPRTSIGSAGK
jgi:hypothetical protein